MVAKLLIRAVCPSVYAPPVALRALLVGTRSGHGLGGRYHPVRSPSRRGGGELRLQFWEIVSIGKGKGEGMKGGLLVVEEI